MRIDPNWFQALVDASPAPPADEAEFDGSAYVGQIEALLSGSGEPDARDVRALDYHFFLQAEVEGAETRKCADVARRLAEYLQNGRSLASVDDTERWTRAVAAAAALNIAQPQADFYIAIHYAGLAEVARQAKQLKTHGVLVTVVEGRLDLDLPTLETFCRQLDDDVRRYGGLDLAAETFRRIARLYDPVQERYHVGRRAPQVPRPNAKADIPTGYLLNLAVKHQENPLLALPDPGAFRGSIEERATALAACINVQPYSSLDGMFADARSLPHLLQRIAVYDATFTLFQLRPKDVPRLMRGLFDWVDDTVLNSLVGFTIPEAVSLTELILTLGQRSGAHLVFTRRQLEDSGVRTAALDPLLRDLAHDPRPNIQFLAPHESGKVDYWFRPLLKRGDAYVLVNPSWCAPAFYEAIANTLRKCGYPGDVGSAIGKATERLVRRELKQHGIVVRSGSYNMDGQEGECDAVVETEADIILIELKAKALTRRSREGSDVQLLIDLAESLVAAQLQLGQHEILLRRHGHLDLKQPDGSLYRLELRGRQIERIATTLLDFGGLQDRTVLRHVLSVLTSTRYGTRDEKKQTKFDDLKVECERLLQQTSELASFDSRLGQDPFYWCGFLSVPQLLILLDDVCDPESFERALSVTRHMSFGTLDFYFEHARMKKIRANRPTENG